MRIGRPILLNRLHAQPAFLTHLQGLKWLLAQEESTGMRVLQQDSENFMATVS